MPADSAVEALIAVATQRLDTAEDEIRALRAQVSVLQADASERKGRDVLSARIIPWLALAVSLVSAGHVLGFW